MNEIRDVCFEVHGIACAMTKSATGVGGNQRVTIIADGDFVMLNKSEGTGFPAAMNPDQARYLATKLYRCARLVEQRRRRVKALTTPVAVKK
jgi:hypothetical protein